MLLMATGLEVRCSGGCFLSLPISLICRLNDWNQGSCTDSMIIGPRVSSPSAAGRYCGNGGSTGSFWNSSVTCRLKDWNQGSWSESTQIGPRDSCFLSVDGVVFILGASLVMI
jgi:hypothetical protein